ncbi:MAG: HAD family hydrolase [Clostridia bacterium]|nr:HAD family hydrolase [Clostridia bacterium]
MDCKVIIFDFDGTFYSGKHKYDNVKDNVDADRRKFFPKLSDKQYNKLIEDEPKFLEMESTRDIVNYMKYINQMYPKLKVDVTDFYNWQNSTHYDVIIDPKELVDLERLESLCKEKPVYVVSNSSPTHVEYYMKKIGVKKKWFQDVISNEFDPFDTTKKHYYIEIMNREKVEPEDVVVLGDDKLSDLRPAEQLGMHTIYSNNAKTLLTKLDKFLSKKTTKK